MRVQKFFLAGVVIAPFVMATPAQAGAGKCDRRYDPLCEAHHRQAAAPVPYNKCLVRVRIKQRGTQKVTVMFFDSEDRPIDKADHLHTQMKGPDAVSATGCGWWQRAVKVIICNDEVARTAHPEVITLYIRQRGTAPGHWVDLRPR